MARYQVSGVRDGISVTEQFSAANAKEAMALAQASGLVVAETSIRKLEDNRGVKRPPQQPRATPPIRQVVTLDSEALREIRKIRKAAQTCAAVATFILTLILLYSILAVM